MRASPSFAAAHSFAKNANEWGARLSFPLHSSQWPRGLRCIQVLLYRHLTAIMSPAPGAPHIRVLCECVGVCAAPLISVAGGPVQAPVGRPRCCCSLAKCPENASSLFSSQTPSEHHHRLPTARRRQWRSTCSRGEVCPSPRRSSKPPSLTNRRSLKTRS